MKKLMFFSIIFVITITRINAQWVQTNGPYSTTVSSIATIGTNIFAGASGGVFLSTNNGNSWTLVNNGMINTSINALATNGNNIFAGTSGGGIYLSTNNGASWTQVNNGLTTNNIMSLAISGTNIFAGTSGGIYLSTNNGGLWTPVDNGIPTNLPIHSIAISDSNIFIGTSNGGIYLSTNNGGLWTPVDNGIPTSSGAVCSIVISGTNIFAGTYGTGYGVYFSNNNGSSWTAVNNGLPINPSIMSLTISGTTIFAGTNSYGVFVSTDNGNSWASWNTGGLANEYINSLNISGTTIYAGTTSGYVWKRSLSEILPQCNASFTYLADTLTGIVNFTASAGTTDSSAFPITYTWNFGDGTSATTNYDTISHVYNTFGYTACIAIQTANGCSSTFCDSVIKNPNPSCQASFYAMIDTANGGSNIYSFINYSSPDNNSTITVNLWNFGDGTSSTAQNPIHSFGSGLHYVCLTIATSSGCTSTYCDSIYVNSNPCQLYANITTYNPTTIGGHDGYIESSVSGGTPPYTYYWNNGATTPNIYNLTSGMYTLNVVDANQCQNTFYASLYEPYDTTGGQIVDTLYTNPFDSCLNFVPDSFYISTYTIDSNTVSVVWVFVGGGQTATITMTYTFSYYGNTLVVLTLNCGSKKTLTTYQSYINIRHTLSVPSYGNEMGVFAYPVPFSAQLSINFTTQQAGDVNIFLMDASGRMLISKKVNALSGTNTCEINTSQLHAGVYILNLVSGNGSIRKQVVK